MSTAIIQVGEAFPDHARYFTVYDGEKPVASVSRPDRRIGQHVWAVTFTDNRTVTCPGPRTAMLTIRRHLEAQKA